MYIVGGANSAGQAAVYLSRGARSVTILIRGNSLEASMSYYLIQQIEKNPKITVRTCTEVVGAEGDDHLERITLRNRATGEEDTVNAQWLFIFIGAAPLTDWLGDVVVRDGNGFVLAGPDLPSEGVTRTGGRSTAHHIISKPVSQVFVAGDVHAESAKRVASAVGEGAMAVMFVHRYLAQQ
ncbi:NAD(P)/FAD-dependent oxidoreductase [Rhodococcus sp. 3Y1]